MARTQTESVKHRRLSPLVFASGAAALTYAVLWVRDWGLLYGVTAVGTAVVLAAGFSGLALGSWVGGRWARTAHGLRLYATLEVAVAASVVVYVLLRPLLPVAVAALAAAVRPTWLPAVHVVFAFAVLLLPTALLGARLPVVSAALPAGDVTGAARVYAWNVLGGALGVLACDMLAVRVVGVRGTFCLAVVVNLAVAGAAFTRTRRARFEPTRSRPRALRPARPLAASAVAALAGGVGLAAEVLWSRGLSGVLSNSVYSLTLGLAAVLIGWVIGTAVGLRLLRRVGTLDAAVSAVAAGLALAVCGSALALRSLAAVSLVLIRAFAVSGPTAGFTVEVLLALLVVLAPAIALGALFPLSLALDGTHVPSVSVGRLLAVNTAGGICGALGGAFVLLPWLGLGGGLSTLAALAAAVAFGFADRTALRVCATTVLVLATATATGLHALRLPWPEPSADRILYYRDGATATVSVSADAYDNKRLRINGQYAFGSTQSVLLEARQAYLPLLLHPAPHSLLALGVGTADTVGAAVLYPGLTVTGVELAAETLDAARLFAAENQGVLDNPQAHFVAEDARSFLRRTPLAYDVILADLFLPWTAGTAYLYSGDFYQLGLAHLQPGGIYCQWLPLHQLAVGDLEAIVATFAAVFPHTQLWLAYHRSMTPLAALLGSAMPPPTSAETLAPRFASPRLGRGLDAVGWSDAAELAALYVSDGAQLRQATAAVRPLTDDRPRLEFSAPAAYFHQQGLGAAALTWIAAHMDPGAAPIAGAPPLPFELRRTLIDAQLALLDGNRPRELANYIDAFRLAPSGRAVREALLAIARERLAAGDQETARLIADEMARGAPKTAEMQALVGLLPR